MFKLKTTASFECAHRLYSVETYSDECRANVHGHSYYVTFYISRKELNDAGMIMDFNLEDADPNKKYISLCPMFSGYRDEHDLSLQINNNYSDFYMIIFTFFWFFESSFSAYYLKY